LAVGNMPIAREEPLAWRPHAGDGSQTTPTMSSYLLFFAVGDFERLATKGPGGIDVGIVSPAAAASRRASRSNRRPQILAYYTDYFGVPYPLPKLDNVAAPASRSSSARWRTGARS
jgi:aminopeptidase N